MSGPIPSTKQERDWRMYVDDMVSFAEKVLAYTEGLERSELEASGLTFDATVRNLELIGEAATVALFWWKWTNTLRKTSQWNGCGGSVTAIAK